MYTQKLTKHKFLYTMYLAVIGGSKPTSAYVEYMCDIWCMYV